MSWVYENTLTEIGNTGKASWEEENEYSLRDVNFEVTVEHLERAAQVVLGPELKIS